MISVWILVFYMKSTNVEFRSGGPAIIDNIATQEECRRVAKVVMEADGAYYARCIEVRKINPNERK